MDEHADAPGRDTGSHTRTGLGFDPIREAHRQWRQRWAAADPMAAVTSVVRVNQLVLGRINQLLRPFGLSFARYEALVLLLFSRRGSLPLGKMGERLMVHPTSVTNTVDRLEEQGLVRRVPHPTDRRRTLAEITPAGRKVVETATAVLVHERFGVGTMTDGEAATLTDLLTTLRRAAGDERTTPENY
jgi:DNA-binding MarR family transcriptional regulator